MNKVKALLLAVLFLSLPVMTKADGKYGKDITIKGKVVQAVVDETSGKLYVLEPESVNEPLPDVIKPGAEVTVDGDEMTKEGHMAIRVEGVK